MDDDSFGAMYAHIDETDSRALLAYLDQVAMIPAVRGAKRAASATLALGPGHRVLDVGCGTGVDLLDLAARVGPDGTVYGSDPSVRALDAARQLVRGRREIELVQAAVEELPFTSGSLDACRADRTLQHVPDPEGALRELRRILKPGGRLVVLEMASYLTGEAGDPAVAARITDRLWLSSKREAWLPYMLPLLARQAGFEGVEVNQERVDSSTLAEAAVVLRLQASIDEAVNAGAVERLQADAWVEELKVAEQRGTFLLSMYFARVSAVAA